MEPKNGRLKQTKTKTMTRISTQKTNASNDDSNGRATADAKKKGASVSTPPMAPPRLRSRKGGTTVTNAIKQKPRK